MKRKNKGFTLIELIVSVTIIAILTIVGMVSFSGTNSRTRDSRRVADLENIRMALELYRQGSGNNNYPANADMASSLAPKYIKEIPKDPKIKNVDYIYDSDGLTYNLCAKVEDIGSTSTVTGGVCGDIDENDYVGFYKVTNP